MTNCTCCKKAQTIKKTKTEKSIGTGHCSCGTTKRCSSGCITAFANIVSPESNNVTNETQGPFINPRMSNKGIASVELVGIGEESFGYKVIFKEGFFKCGVNIRPPIVQVTPCESFEFGTTSEEILSENAALWCNSVNYICAIIVTGRWDPNQTGPFPITSPTLDVDFNITAFQSIDGDDITIENQV